MRRTIENAQSCAAHVADLRLQSGKGSGPMQACNLSVVVPAKDEEYRLPSTLKQITDRLTCLGVSYEIIVVNDGSQDGTVHVARSWNAKVIENADNKGIAASFRLGARSSSGRTVMLCPADVSDFDFLEGAVKAAASFDVVSVSKRHKKSIVIGYNRRRWFLSNGYHMCVRTFLGRLECTDTHYIKLYNRNALNRVLAKCRLNGPVGETEIMLYLKDLGSSFFEVPAKIIHTGNGSKMSSLLILRSMNELMRLFVQGTLGL